MENKKEKNSKKKILITIGIIVAILVGLVAYGVVTDLYQEKKLKKELDYLYEITNKEDYDEKEIDKILNRTVTTGDYKKVERVARIAGIGNKLILSLVVGSAFYLGVPVIKDVLAMIPEFIINGMDVAAGMLPAIGFAMLARMIITKELSPYLLAGFLLAAYVNVPVFGVALAGLVIAALVFFKELKQQKEQVIVDDNEF